MQAPPASGGSDAIPRLRLRAAAVETRHLSTREFPGAVPVLRGRNLWHFTDRAQPVGLWTTADAAESALGEDLRRYRFGVRAITGAWNQRTLIGTILPPGVAVKRTVLTSADPEDPEELLLVTALLSSLVADWEARLVVNTTASAYFVHQLHVPRVEDADLRRRLVQGTAGLVCTRPEFDALADAVGLTRAGEHASAANSPRAVVDPQHRWRLECVLNALAARAYGLSRDELEAVLASFPLVSGDTRLSILEEFERPLEGDQ